MDQQEGQQLPKGIKPMKILIGIPSRGEFKQDMSLSLIFMMIHITQNRFFIIDGQKYVIMWQILCTNTSNLPQSRQTILDAALEQDVDFLLFLDDDMVFPHTLLHEWLAENRPVMAANCPTRAFPVYATARKQSLREPGKGDVVYSDIANYRFDKVWRVGTGVMMLRRDAMQALPRPAFTQRWEPLNDAYVGEDWVMCEHLEAAGIPIIVDHEISEQIEHIGSMHYTHKHAKATRIAAAKQSGTDAHAANGAVSPDQNIIIARG